MQEEKNVNKKGFLKGMRAELKKVIWPTGKQTVKSTAVTITFVLLISIILIVLNTVFGALSNLWLSSLSDDDIIINNVVSGESNVENNAVSGEASGEVSNSGDVLSGEMVSGE